MSYWLLCRKMHYSASRGVKPFHQPDIRKESETRQVVSTKLDASARRHNKQPVQSTPQEGAPFTKPKVANRHSAPNARRARFTAGIRRHHRGTRTLSDKSGCKREPQQIRCPLTLFSLLQNWSLKRKGGKPSTMERTRWTKREIILYTRVLRQ